MAIKIKSLKTGVVSNTETSLATVASDKAVVVKNIRFVNPGADAVTLTVKLNSWGLSTIKLPAGFAAVEEQEITLATGDALTAELAESEATVDFVTSGMERDAI